jgi:hypothetical protein
MRLNEEPLRITWVNLTGAEFVLMCEEFSLTEDSDNWQVFEIGRLNILNNTLFMH